MGLTRKWMKKRRPNWLEPCSRLKVSTEEAVSLFASDGQSSSGFAGPHMDGEYLNICAEVCANVAWQQDDLVLISFSLKKDGKHLQFKGAATTFRTAVERAISYAYSDGYTVKNFQ